MIHYTRGRLLQLLSREFTDEDVRVLDVHPEVRERVLRLVRAPHEIPVPVEVGYEIMGEKCVHLEACEEVFARREEQVEKCVRLSLPSTAPVFFKRIPYSAEQLERYRETHTLLPMFPVTISALLQLFAEEVFYFIGERGWMIGQGMRSWFHCSSHIVEESPIFWEETPRFGWKLVRTSYPNFSRSYYPPPEEIPFGSPERLMRPCEFAFLFVLHSKLALLKWQSEHLWHDGKLTCGGNGNDLPFTYAEIHDNRCYGIGHGDTLRFDCSHGEHPATLVKPLPICS